MSNPTHSPALTLPYMMPAQAQKHIVHNEALQWLDRLTQMRVADFTLSAPPPQDQRRDDQLYWTGEAPSGEWAGETSKLAFWDRSNWQFLTPKPGYVCVVPLTGELRVFNGSDWIESRSGNETSSQIGINMSADSTNRLSVRADGSLFTHDGDSHRISVNRKTDTDTASLVLQTDYTASAEIGLTGGRDLAIKCSPDGITYRKVMSFDATNGRVTIAEDDQLASLNIHGDLQLQKTGTAEPSSPTVFDITASGVSGAPYTLTRFFTYSPADWQGNYFMAYRARGEASAPQALQGWDLIYSIDSYAHDGTDMALAARLAFHAGGPAGSPAVGGRMTLSLGDANGTEASNPSARVLSIDSDKSLRCEGRAEFGGPIGLATFTQATLPSAAVPGRMIYVEDLASGPAPAYSDGTAWRSLIDGLVLQAA